MNTEELTQIATAHQSAINRQGQWQVEHETRMARVEAILEAVATQQQLNAQQIAQNQQAIAQNQQAIAQNQQAIANLTAESQLSRQDINSLTASILELRNMVADYIASRKQTE